MDFNVTIVVANHNYARFARDAIDSAAADVYPHKQLVFVDDGSTDNSAQIVCKEIRDARAWVGDAHAKGMTGLEGFWKDTDLPILLIGCSPARGPSAARNVAIRAAWDSTDCFAILDADDKHKPEKLTQLVAALHPRHECVGVVYADYDHLDESGTLTREFKEPFSSRRLRQECIVHSGSLITKWCLASLGCPQSGPYDENMRVAEDWSLWGEICDAGWELRHVPESLSIVRVGSHGSSSTVQSEIWQQCWTKVQQKYHERAASGKVAIRGSL